MKSLTQAFIIMLVSIHFAACSKSGEPGSKIFSDQKEPLSETQTQEEIADKKAEKDLAEEWIGVCRLTNAGAELDQITMYKDYYIHRKELFEGAEGCVGDSLVTKTKYLITKTDNTYLAKMNLQDPELKDHKELVFTKSGILVIKHYYTDAFRKSFDQYYNRVQETDLGLAMYGNWEACIPLNFEQNSKSVLVKLKVDFGENFDEKNVEFETRYYKGFYCGRDELLASRAGFSGQLQRLDDQYLVIANEKIENPKTSGYNRYHALAEAQNGEGALPELVLSIDQNRQLKLKTNDGEEFLLTVNEITD